MRKGVVWQAGLVIALVAFAKTGAIQDTTVRHDNGQTVVPFYEGWYRDTDGSIRLSFGYLNFNYGEEVDIAIGPDNRIAPGEADQGQPTHFLRRRQVGVFAVRLSGSSTKTELTWTINFRGKSTSIPASLDPLYEIYGLRMTGQRTFDNGGIPADNTPPVLKFAADGRDGVGPAGVQSAARVSGGAPLSIDLWASDDGFPMRGGKPAGITLTWTKYRGPGDVTFAPPTAHIDGRSGKTTTSVTFSKPGDYELRVLATDGSGFNEQCCWTNGYVRVAVGAASGG